MVERSQDTWIDELTLTEKCRLLGGATNWRTHAVERLGLPALKMSDGPNGVRGELSFDIATPSVVVPGGNRAGCDLGPGPHRPGR